MPYHGFEDALPDEVDIVKRGLHLGFVFGLRELGCTYSTIKGMAKSGTYWSDRHRLLWESVGYLIDPELIEWAKYTLDTTSPANAFSDNGNNNQDPDDEIVGYPHHVIFNGDHSGCSCGGHTAECESWGLQLHKASLCNIRRQLCTHHPRHTYGQVCDVYCNDGPEVTK